MPTLEINWLRLSFFWANNRNFGHCAAKKTDYFGFKLGLRISRSGMITYFLLLSARVHDVNHLGSLIEGFSGRVRTEAGTGISRAAITILDASGNTVGNAMTSSFGMFKIGGLEAGNIYTIIIGQKNINLIHKSSQ